MQKLSRPGKLFKDEYTEIEYLGFTFYTSEKLKQEVIDILYKYAAKSNAQRIESLIKKGKFIPVLSTMSTLDILKRKLHLPVRNTYEEMGKIRGVFYKPADVILLMADSEISFLSGSEYYIVRLSIHEMIHYATFHHMQQFLKVNIKILYEFYSAYFYHFLHEKENNQIPKEKIIKIIYLISKFESMSNPKSLLTPYRDLLMDLQEHSEFNEVEFLRRVTLFMTYLQTYLKTDVTSNIIDKFIDVINPLYWAYEDVFKFPLKKQSFHTQEFTVLSEVIAELAIFNYKHPNVVKTINLIKS